jgi:hypothetical protein
MLWEATSLVNKHTNIMNLLHRYKPRDVFPPQYKLITIYLEIAKMK